MGQDRLQDLLNFNRWLDASTQGNATLTRLYEVRFRPQFRPAFQAWLLQDPLNNPAATPSPLLMPQYHPPEVAAVNQLERKADQAFNGGRDATDHTDNYVFTTVFFAAVLFFAGISMRFAWLQMRIVVLGLGALCLAYALDPRPHAPLRLRRQPRCSPDHRADHPDREVGDRDDAHAADGVQQPVVAGHDHRPDHDQRVRPDHPSDPAAPHHRPEGERGPHRPADVEARHRGHRVRERCPFAVRSTGSRR